MHHGYKGCSAVSNVDINIISLVAMGTVPPEAVLKAYIPALTIGRLLSQSIPSGSRVRLLKTDLEGLDQPILHQMLDHYENRTGFNLITMEYPCVVFFETKIQAANWKDATLFKRFTAIGYAFFEGLVDDAGKLSEEDAMAVNCLCNREDFTVALALLAPNTFDIDSVLSIC